MNRRNRTIAQIASLVALCAIAYAGYRLFRASSPHVPAVVYRHANAAALVSRSLPARVDRLLHDRIPAPNARGNDPRLIALTFDDGPYPVLTPLLLDELAALKVPATFFLIGDDTEIFPSFAARIHAQGDEIANHTMTHPARFDTLSPAAVTRELDLGAATLERYVRDPSIRTMMRPPHGRYTLRTLQTAQHDGYDVVLWNDDPGDWRSVAPQRILDHMADNATAPEIVLLHSGRLNTIDALPEIVARFRAAGFTFVTAGQLLGRVPAVQILHPEKLRV